ncbi:MAG TPA: AbrB/MazE/SpoVT family DNA-binding domain-containing protein [bacterium]|nr:AbrB/MazE/SpoVT family DNA-binding domain-containing protein [bacterium]HPN67429.1 AbrB/MazE/SpoVT family DNA-binding domain-containing protein [bacterium]
MTKKIQCFGTTTIGPKGQIVIPAKLRKSLNIKIGDQFIVFKNDHIESIIIMKTENISHMLKDMSEQIDHIKKSLS